MTVINPNSVAGINSITVQSGNALSVHKSDGTLIRTITESSGISTFTSVSVGSATTDNSANNSINVGLGASISQHATNSLSFGTGGDERARIDSDGKLKIGTTATPTQSGALNVFGTDQATSQISVRRGSGDAAGPRLHFQKSRNTTDGSHTVVQDDDVLGQIVFAGNDAGGPENGALISAEVDGSPGGNDMPARLVFSTTPDGSDTLAERLRIDSTGDINVSTAATIKSNGNATFSGIVTAASFIGDGSGLTGAGPSLTGSTNNTIVTVTGANAIQGETNLTFDGTRLNVGGTGVSQNRTVNIGSDSEANLAIETHNTSASETANIRFYRSRGTAASPTTLVDGDVIAQHIFYGHDGTDYANTAAVIKVQCSSTVASNSVPSSMIFSTNGASTSATERLRLTHDGDLTMGNSTGYSIWKMTGNDQRCRYQFRQTTGNNRGAAFLEERGDANGMDVFISKSRDGSGVGAINSGDTIGNLKFTGADGTRQHNAATIQVYNSGTIATGRVAGNMSIYTAPDSVNQQIERLRIDATGDVKVVSRGSGTSGAPFYVAVEGKSSISYSGGSDDTACLRVVDNGSTNSYYHGIELRGKRDGDARIYMQDMGSDASDLVFATDNSGITEKMRITAAGEMLINSPSEAAGKIGIKGTNSSGSTCYAVTNSGKAQQGIDITCTTVGDGNYGGAVSFGCGGNGRSAIAGVQHDSSDDDRTGLSFFTHDSNTGADNNAETMRINGMGQVIIGATDFNASVGQSNAGVSLFNTNAGSIFAAGGTTTQNQLIFTNPNGVVGRIQSTNSSTSYLTSSDYRIKENAVSISDGITRLKTLKPYRFNFKSNPSVTVDGFFAHEVTAVPEAIDGTKDEVFTADTVVADHKVGDPKYQSIDQSKLIPLLTAALQEAVTKIETLETKVAALEGG